MNHIDQIISALFLSKTDNREKMLSWLITNVLYNIEKPSSLEDICQFINDTFHLQPIKFEIEQCIDSLLEEDKIITKEGLYKLRDQEKEQIYKSILTNSSVEEKRRQTFNQLLVEQQERELPKKTSDLLWNVFNEYLLECFLVFGKRAINIFLPYKNDSLNENHEVIDKALSNFSNEEETRLFKKIVFEYPNRLNEAELRFLNNLANRAEKFYSLGVPEQEYDRIKNLQIKDLIILVDTNFLYSVLEFRKHSEDNAIGEVVRLCKEDKIDLRLVYLPKTYGELQKAKKYLEKVIPRNNYNTSHMKALVRSEKLDPFAKKFYEQKLLNSETPHPSQKIAFAKDVLLDRNIKIYNPDLNELSNENEDFKNKVIEYYDFQNYYNAICEEKEYDYRYNKDAKKIDHDVYLREAVKKLKSKFGKTDELNFVCLTLDRSVLQFDHYVQREKDGVTKRIMHTPTFMLPSIFLKKIRPFMPVVSVDYRKAFLASLTTPNLDREDYEESLIVQKSMSYFKSLGIDDEEIIYNCIRRELFLEEFTEKDKSNTAEEFIKSEISNEIDRLKKEHEQSKQESQKQAGEYQKHLAKIEQENTSLTQKKVEVEAELESKKDNYEELQREKERVIQESERIAKENEERLKGLEEKHQEQVKATESIQADLKYEREQNQWNTDKSDFLESSWKKEIDTLKKAQNYFLKVLFLTILPAIIGIVLKANQDISDWIASLGDKQWLIWGTLILILFAEVTLRSYIFDKVKVKLGYTVLLSKFSKARKTKLKKDYSEKYTLIFDTENPTPKLKKHT